MEHIFEVPFSAFWSSSFNKGILFSALEASSTSSAMEDYIKCLHSGHIED